MNKIVKRIGILIIIVVAIFGCEKSEDYQIKEPVDLNNLIKSVTSDYLISGNPLVIELHENKLLGSKLGKEEKLFELEFTPSVRGRLVWAGERTLHYEFKDQLSAGKEYIYNLNLKKGIVYNQETAKNYQGLSFKVVGQDIRELEQQINFGEGGKFSLSGEIELLAKVKSTDLRRASYVFYHGKKYKLKWEVINSREFRFKTEEIAYLSEEPELEFVIEGELIKLPYNVNRKVNIEKGSLLYIRQAEMVYQGGMPYIELEFSDDLDGNQDLSLLVEIEPFLEYSIDAYDNIVRINGDYKFNQQYRIKVSSELLGEGNKQPKGEIEVELALEDIKPRARYKDQGVFLSSESANRLYFETVNVKKVNYRITHIFTNNICQYFQEDNLYTESGNRYNGVLRQVGREIGRGELNTGAVRNKWQQHELDISGILPEGNYGIFVVELSFDQEDILYRENQLIPSEVNRWANPMDYRYYYENGSISKTVVISDIAITFKQGEEQSFCAVTDVVSGKPLKGAKVQVLDYHNQLSGEGETDWKGFCLLKTAQEPFLVRVSHNEQESFLKLNSNQWETSIFKVGGKAARGNNLQAFIYTEREVYRPGDEINFSLILRNQTGSFPSDHPLQLELYDPRYRLIKETVLKESRDGFYNYSYESSLDAPTGRWLLKLKVGEEEFSSNVRIETIAAERLKLSFEPEAEVISADKDSFLIALEAKYLFGRPATGLTVNFTHSLTGIEKQFSEPRWKKFSFIDQSRKPDSYQYQHITSVLDDEGKAELQWQRPAGKNIASAGILEVKAEVINQGGRASREQINLAWDPWEYYTGIKSSQTYINKQGDNYVELILLDRDGKPVSGKDLRVKVYDNDLYWWWEYDSYHEFRQQFKQATSTRLVAEKLLLSQLEALEYKLPEISGRNVLVEVTHIDNEGEAHRASKFLYSSYWAESSSRELASVVDLKSDKSEYHPGEKVHLEFPMNEESQALITLESGEEILDWWWYKPLSGHHNAQVEIPVTSEMLPGIYASVSVHQSQDSRRNDCPLRCYGILPIRVTQKDTKLNLELELPEVIRPQESFKCKVKIEDQPDVQLTVAVVDEGLLSLTDYQTPQPWEYFYGKERLSIKTSDNYELFMEKYKGDIAQRFSVGGGIEMYHKRQVEKTEIKRFEPVCLYSGILTTNSSGEVEVEFAMPDYLGAVRVMAVGAKGASYGSAARTVTVRKELMLMPTLPRALAVGDKIQIPVEVFSFEDDITRAEVSLQATSPIQIKGNSSQTVELDERGEALAIFEAEMGQEIEPVKFEFSVKSGDNEHHREVVVPVRATEPYELKVKKLSLKAGEEGKLKIERDGLPGSEKSSLVFQREGYFEMKKQLAYLLQYPYGCLEQTISAAFAQINVSDIIDPRVAVQIMGDVTENISIAMQKLSAHQLANGGFSYWREGGKADAWISVYATHFLVEASSRGYHIPGAIEQKAIGYLTKDARLEQGKQSREELTLLCYQLYVLSLAGQPQVNLLNYLKERRLEDLSSREKWLLAGAYQEAGLYETAEIIARGAGIEIEVGENSYRNNYGSIERDQGMILALAAQLDQTSLATNLYHDLAKILNDDTYLSTHSRAFVLWGLSSYASRHPEQFSTEPVKMSYKSQRGGRREILIEGNRWEIDLEGDLEVELELSEHSAQGNFALYYDRIPTGEVAAISSDNFGLKRFLTGLNDKRIQLTELKQGESFYLNLVVERKALIEAEHLALTQILPSGWEIINDRYAGGENHHNSAEYIDIRDDRIIWFFDYHKHENKNEKKFKIRLRAVTAGIFKLPSCLLESMYSLENQVRLTGQETTVSR